MHLCHQYATCFATARKWRCAREGSGKTHTVYGGEGDPGLTPRGITELFDILDRDGGKYTFSVSCYMLELYQDDLADLLLPQGTIPRPSGGQAKARPRLRSLLLVVGAFGVG